MRLGTPELRGTGVTELRLISDVNEAIKLSIEASGKIGLLAINANLIAGRAGVRAVGFCVVAGELRRFSDGMANMMQGWSNLIYALVRETARSRNQARRLGKLKAAGRYSEKAREAISASYLRSRDALHTITNENSMRVLELQGMIQRAEKQRITGEVIARSAMIESAYGGTMRAALQQVALDIDAGISSFTSFSRNVGCMMQRAAA
jgi:hypothetical protein